jgi:membrane-associated protease RseP (regulator of RpoE activity)
VLLAEPKRTQFDLSFSVLGFPVRVHPLFWLIGVLIGFTGSSPDSPEFGISLIIWLLVVFVSILIHELGHAVMIRRYGRDAYIVLYAMGGLAIEGRPRGGDPFGNPWSIDSTAPSYGTRERTPAEQIAISAAGPGIQLILAGLIVVLIYAIGGRVAIDQHGWLPLPVPVLPKELADNENLWRLFFALLEINIFWALINLLPVLPLDGGQIALQVFTQQDPWGGMRRALWLSIFTGGAAAIVGALVMQDMLMLMLFGSLALSSYLTLQQIGGVGGGRRPW